ncbi:MAG: SRPBCC domain-containing protein [Terriglobia bacterium]
MKAKLLILIFLLGAGSNAAAQQHARRPVKPPDKGPVTVMRSATLQVFIASDTVDVFSYLSDQGKLTTWFADQAILEPEFGGKYHFRWKNQEPVDGVVTDFTPGNSLAFTWKHATDAAETQVGFKLSPQGGRTLIELGLQGFSSTAALDKATDYWVFYLQNLKSVIEDQVDRRQPAPKAPAHPAAHARPKQT